MRIYYITEEDDNYHPCIFEMIDGKINKGWFKDGKWIEIHNPASCIPYMNKKRIKTSRKKVVETLFIDQL